MSTEKNFNIEDVIKNGSKIQEGLSATVEAVLEKKTKSRQAYKLAVKIINAENNKNATYISAKINEKVGENNLRRTKELQNLLDEFKSGKIDEITYDEKCNDINRASDKLENEIRDKYQKLQDQQYRNWRDQLNMINESDFTEK